jgi:hypothetical protein
MRKSTSDDLAELVRQILPKPILGKSWHVHVVDKFDDAGAELYGGVVYVHSTWLESIWNTGLSYVTRHHPLAVQPFMDANPELVLRNGLPAFDRRPATVCRAITIERSYSRGLFTGGMTIGEAFIARSCDGLWQYADRDRNRAIRQALRAARSKEGRDRYEAYRLVDLRNRAQQLVLNIGSQRTYDCGALVPLAPYEQLLPPKVVDLLQLYHKQRIYPPQGLPFPVIWAQAVEAIPDMNRDKIVDLVLRLAFDLPKQPSINEEDHQPLDEEDVAALALLSECDGVATNMHES